MKPLRAPTVEEMIAQLQLDYDWIMKQYRDPGSKAYKLPGAKKMLRDDLRAIINLRKEQNAKR